jgi:hypothetical protein
MARDAVFHEADEQGIEPRDLASTLLVVVMTPWGNGAIQLGDGVIVLRTTDSGWCYVFWPERGESWNSTYFLTDDDALHNMQVDLLPGTIMDVALMSDGLESLAIHYASHSVHDPFFNGMFRPLSEADGTGELRNLSIALEHFLSSDKIGLRTDDDVSLILATRQCGERSKYDLHVA